MNQLPKEIWTEIFLYENKDNYYPLAFVCKDFYEIMFSITNQTNISHLYENKELLKECYYQYPTYRCYFSYLLQKKKPEWIKDFTSYHLSYFDTFKAIQHHNIQELKKYIDCGCYHGPELYIESIKHNDIDIFHYLYETLKIPMTKKIYKQIYKHPIYKQYQRLLFLWSSKKCKI